MTNDSMPLCSPEQRQQEFILLQTHELSLKIIEILADDIKEGKLSDKQLHERICKLLEVYLAADTVINRDIEKMCLNMRERISKVSP